MSPSVLNLEKLSQSEKAQCWCNCLFHQIHTGISTDESRLSVFATVHPAVSPAVLNIEWVTRSEKSQCWCNRLLDHIPHRQRHSEQPDVSVYKEHDCSERLQFTQAAGIMTHSTEVPEEEFRLPRWSFCEDHFQICAISTSIPECVVHTCNTRRYSLCLST